MPDEAREGAEVEQQPTKAEGASNWKGIAAYGGGGTGLCLIAAFFVSQFDDLKEELKTVSHSVTAMDTKLTSMDSARVRDQRELEIRLERLEEWRASVPDQRDVVARIAKLEEFRARVPDGTGLDRWTGKDMYIFSLELKDANRSIDLKVPDPREIHGR